MTIYSVSNMYYQSPYTNNPPFPLPPQNFPAYQQPPQNNRVNKSQQKMPQKNLPVVKFAIFCASYGAVLWSGIGILALMLGKRTRTVATKLPGGMPGYVLKKAAFGAGMFGFNGPWLAWLFNKFQKKS
jgi:hypothetical protein